MINADTFSSKYLHNIMYVYIHYCICILIRCSSCQDLLYTSTLLMLKIWSFLSFVLLATINLKGSYLNKSLLDINSYI